MRSFLLFNSTALLLFALGCGSSNPVEKASAPTKQTNSNSSSSQGNAGPQAPAIAENDQPNTEAQADQAVSEVKVPPAGSTPTSPMLTARARQLEAMKRQGPPRTSVAEIEGILKRSTRPAPENSEFSVALTDVLVERRVFLRHPVLAKAEKVTEGDKKTLYVFTKDGDRREVPGERIESLSTASSGQILMAAGIELPKREPTGTKPRATKN